MTNKQRMLVCAVVVASGAGIACGGSGAAPGEPRSDAAARGDEPRLWGCLRADTPHAMESAGTPGHAATPAAGYHLDIVGPNGGIWAAGGRGLLGHRSALRAGESENESAGEHAADEGVRRVALAAEPSLGLDRHVKHMLELGGEWRDEGRTFHATSLMMISAACSS